MAALVRAHFDVESTTPGTFPGGAARAAEGRGWVLVEADPSRALGKAMAWARQHDVDDLHVLAEDGAGVLARQAALFADAPTVWWLNGTELHPTEPEPLIPPGPLVASQELVSLLHSVGLEVVDEWDHVAGEWRGLELARVVGDRLEVGVGEADRELTAMLHGDLAPEDALRRVITIVGQHRRPDAPRHPLNQLVPERWLRWTLPGVTPARPAQPRAGLRERDIAAGIARDGVVVCSVGVDLEVVPSAGEARLALDPEAPLIITIPERDDHPITRALARRLLGKVEIRTVSGDWRS